MPSWAAAWRRSFPRCWTRVRSCGPIPAGTRSRASGCSIRSGSSRPSGLPMARTSRRSSDDMRATSWTTANTPRSRRRARISASGSTGSRRSAATSAWRSSGCCTPGRPTRRCGSRSRSRARCPGMPMPMRSAAGSRRCSAHRRSCPRSAAQLACTGTACSLSPRDSSTTPRGSWRRLWRRRARRGTPGRGGRSCCSGPPGGARRGRGCGRALR